MQRVDLFQTGLHVVGDGDWLPAHGWRVFWLADGFRQGKAFGQALLSGNRFCR